MSQIALLQWSHGPWTPHMLDMGPTLLLTSPPHCHVQGGFCIIPASWLPGSHSGGLQVLLVKLRSHACPGARRPGKMRAQRGPLPILEQHPQV